MQEALRLNVNLRCEGGTSEPIDFLRVIAQSCGESSSLDRN
jgi:hypothetical protein